MTDIVRSYTASDRPAVRKIFGTDEFARPRLFQKYPKLSEYTADEMSYYPDIEPESLFVADVDGQVVGALLGAVSTYRFEQVYHERIRPMLWRRLLSGVYGWPGWLPANLWTEFADVICTKFAERKDNKPKVDPRSRYPAHLHIGVLPDYRRRGLGTRLMERYIEYLRMKGIAGFHLYASSYHWMGIAFYNKFGLELLGQFTWRLHTGFEWVDVVESIYGKLV